MKEIDPSKTGVILIAEERVRQVAEEGWLADHDDEHTDASLALAAVCYASPVPLFVMEERVNQIYFSDPWPDSWGQRYDKRYTYEGGNVIPHPETYPQEKRLDFLVKAGALIAAEIDRLQRLREKERLRAERMAAPVSDPTKFERCSECGDEKQIGKMCLACLPF